MCTNPSYKPHISSEQRTLIKEGIIYCGLILALAASLFLLSVERKGTKLPGKAKRLIDKKIRPILESLRCHLKELQEVAVTGNHEQQTHCFILSFV